LRRRRRFGLASAASARFDAELLLLDELPGIAARHLEAAEQREADDACLGHVAPRPEDADQRTSPKAADVALGQHAVLDVVVDQAAVPEPMVVAGA
jgi:hypothetical protein